MFLPNLQKNIQELERQISRLETECEHSVSSLGRREMSPGPQESAHQPFITGPSLSTIACPPKMPSPPPQDPPSLPTSSRQASKPPEKRPRPSGEDHRGRESRSPEHVGEPKRSESRSPCKGSAREATELGGEGQLSRKILAKLASKLKEVPREPTWCELLGEQTANGGKHQSKSRKEVSRKEDESSDEENCRGGHVAVCERPKESEGAGPPPGSRRSRSARTRKNHPQQSPEDSGPSKSLQEKETQCLLWDDKGKGEFFLSINESVRVLQGLVEELKRKPTHEKRNEVLNDMQDALKRIIHMEESSSLQDAEAPLNDSFSKLPEGAENIMNMKNALFAVKKICEELSTEKAALAEEICVKNVALANSRAKEKEYMAVIANLKYSLEKQKEMADEGMQVKRDLRILSVRLQEEAKVIEALKKSHEKMQELVENYVLENERLKAHVKITKLETQKYNVLLAGKDAEIVKYKREIESFQKQITEQLSLLRSRATESEVQKTIDAISTQASILQKDDESGPQDDDDEDDSMDSSSLKTQATLRVRSPSPLASAASKWDVESKQSNWSSEAPKKAAEGRLSPLKSPRETVRQLELENVLNSSNNLRNSINDLLEDIKREASDVYWLSAPNSCRTSAHSTSNLTTSEDGSDVSQKD